MESLFLFLLVLSGPLLLAGLIWPNFLHRLYRRPLTRGQNLVIYFLVSLFSFIGFGLTSSELDSTNMVSDPQVDFVETSDAEIMADADVVLPESYSLPQNTPVLEEDAVGDQLSLQSLQTYLVTRVIDGDTIDVLMAGENKRVRYIGIDTPETVHPSKSVECFGLEASNKNKELVAGKVVQLVKDISETDKYGRLLRYVYVDGLFVNQTLVQEGFANAYSFPPDIAQSEVFLQAEREAREGGIGLWGDVCAESVTGSPTTEISATLDSSPVTNTNPSCVIKGNINVATEKIFHVPGCQSYNQTKINEEAGERWFCSEKEALDAGWRKALNC